MGRQDARPGNTAGATSPYGASCVIRDTGEVLAEDATAKAAPTVRRAVIATPFRDRPHDGDLRPIRAVFNMAGTVDQVPNLPL